MAGCGAFSWIVHFFLFLFPFLHTIPPGIYVSFPSLRASEAKAFGLDPWIALSR